MINVFIAIFARASINLRRSLQRTMMTLTMKMTFRLLLVISRLTLSSKLKERSF